MENTSEKQDLKDVEEAPEDNKNEETVKEEKE